MIGIAPPYKHTDTHGESNHLDKCLEVRPADASFDFTTTAGEGVPSYGT